MRRLLFRPRLRRFCLGLFALGLVLGLWLGQPRGPVQAADARQLVQLGVDRYQAGRYLAALEPWQQAYTAYKTVQDLPALAIVSENLARAYHATGRESLHFQCHTFRHPGARANCAVLRGLERPRDKDVLYRLFHE